MLPFWIRRSQGDFLQPTDHLQCKTLSGTLATYNVRPLGLVCGPHICREPADVPILGCGSLSSRHVCQRVLCCKSCGSSVWNAYKDRHRLGWQMLTPVIFLQMGESALNPHDDVWEGAAAPRISQPRVIWEMGAETALRKGQHVSGAPKNSIAGSA